MKEKFRNYLLIAGAFGILYFLTSYHIIIYEHDFFLLEKPYHTLEYCFFNITQRRADKILQEDVLREAGIGELLVDLGKVSENEYLRLEAKYNTDYEED